MSGVEFQLCCFCYCCCCGNDTYMCSHQVCKVAALDFSIFCGRFFVAPSLLKSCNITLKMTEKCQKCSFLHAVFAGAHFISPPSPPSALRFAVTLHTFKKVRAPGVLCAALKHVAHLSLQGSLILKYRLVRCALVTRHTTRLDRHTVFTHSTATTSQRCKLALTPHNACVLCISM